MERLTKTCSHSKRSRPQCNTDTCNTWQRAAGWQSLLLGKLGLPPAEVPNCWWHDNFRYLDINLQTLPVTICTTTGLTFNNCTLCPLTHSMVQSASSETNRFPARQEIPQFSRNPMFHYRTHKRPPTLCILFSPVQSIHLHSTSWRSVLILFTNLGLGAPLVSFPFSQTRTYKHSFHHPYAPHAQPICNGTGIFVVFFTLSVLLRFVCIIPTLVWCVCTIPVILWCVFTVPLLFWCVLYRCCCDLCVQ